MTAALAFLRRFWWAVPIVAFAAALLVTRATLADMKLTLANERTAWSDAIQSADKARLDAERRHAMQLAQAAAAYADRLAARVPIIVRSTNTVREYAQTDAGRAMCLGADRVRGIDALAAELAGDPASPSGSDDAL